MDIKSMRYFISAVDNLSFTKAAMEHKVTQTAISLSISKMEDELGFTLFTRKRRTVQLTEAGRVFYEQIISVVNKYEEAVKRGQETAAGKVGELRIGVPDAIMGMSMVHYFREFQNIFPQQRVKVLTIEPQDVMQAISAKELDAAVGFQQMFESNTNLDYRIFRRDHLLIGMSPAHPLADAKEITIDQIKEETLAVVNPQRTSLIHQYVCQIWKEMGIEAPKVVQENSLNDALLDVAMGNAIIQITEQSRIFCSPALVYHSVKELEKYVMELAIAWDKTNDSELVRQLVKTVCEQQECI